MSSRFTDIERVETLAQAHCHLAQPVPGSRYTAAERAETLRQARAHVAEFKKQSKRAERDERTIVYKTVEAQPPPAASEVAGPDVAWWEWVDQRIEEQATVSNDAVGEVIGTLVRDARKEAEQRVAVVSRELELLRREFTVLRDEVGLERELKDLRGQVAKAQKTIPRVPAIEARLRAEANIAGTKTDQEITELRRELKEAQRTIAELQARQSELPDTLEQVVGQAMQNVEFEEYYEAYSRCSVYRPTISPEAAAGLRAFAEKALGAGKGVILEH